MRILLIFCLALTPILSQERALVVELTGKAQVKRSGQKDFVALKVKDFITDQDTVRTGAGSSLKLIFRAIEIRLQADAEITLSQLASGGKAHVAKGFSWYDIKSKQPSAFSVTTPTSVASVRGTKFAIVSGKDGSLSCVCHGEIEAGGTGGKTGVLKKGGSQAVGPDGKVVDKDIARFFKGMLVQRAFSRVIKEDSRYSGCLSCHHYPGKKSGYRR
ncbi:MAG: FecR domain-containing protein [Spirochaetales bacterium]|nr:FecR domain-containing protein [Spirochaetales bacterium]